MSSFLFASLNSKPPTSARKYHIRRLHDVLYLCIQRQDFVRARRAWAILVRCKEVDWKEMWRTSVLLLGEADTDDTFPDTDRIRFLSVMMRQHPDEREAILTELVLRLMHAGRHRDALEELELYLPSYPFQDNPVLHVYAGLICLYLSQPAEGSDDDRWDDGMLRDAQTRFERAKMIDPSNVVAQAFIDELPRITQGGPPIDEEESDEEIRDADDDGQSRKRTKI